MLLVGGTTTIIFSFIIITISILIFIKITAIGRRRDSVFIPDKVHGHTWISMDIHTGPSKIGLTFHMIPRRSS